MSERAYSFELKKNITAKEAVKMSIKGIVDDERAFCCSDEKCNILLTCTNWKNIHGERFYFVPSHNNELHVIGCDEVKIKEEKQQITKEIDDISYQIKNNGIITMMKSPDRNTKGREDFEENAEENKSVKGSRGKGEDKDSRTKSESKRAARIEAFIEVFLDPNSDKNNPMINMDGKLLSLNQIFTSSNRDVEYNRFGIYYGSATVKKCSFNKEMIEIIYDNSELPKIYTSIESLKKVSNGNLIKKMINKENTVVTYFRGTPVLENEKKKFLSFNDKFYKDIYFEI